MHPKCKAPELKIHLVRHGESEWQVGACGSYDSELTDRGHAQALHLARRINYENLTVSNYEVIVSPMKRALQTVQSTGMRFTTLDALKEAQFDIKACLPTFAGPDVHRVNAPPSGAYAEFRAGIGDLLDDLVARARHTDLYAFTHGGVIKTLLRAIHGTDAVCYRIDNCSWTTLAWYHGRWHVECVNDLSHLPQSLRG